MIGPDSEKPKSGGDGDFHDVVAIEFCDGERDLFGFARMAIAPGSGSAAIVALLFAGGEQIAAIAESDLTPAPTDWKQASAGSLRLGIEQPLERWTAALDGDSGFELTLEATTPPLELLDPEVAASAGVEEYEQLCRVTGSVRVNGKRRKIDCGGRRMHIWGAPSWDRLESRRAIYAATPGGAAVTILSSRPAGVDLDEELSSGYIIGAGDDQPPHQLEQILLSTVYGQERMPRSAGAELYLPGEEFGHRLAGEARYEVRLEGDERTHRISFFHWSLDGTRCWGSYQSIGPR